MDIDWTTVLADQLGWHWENQLRPRLDGLTDDEPKLLPKMPTAATLVDCPATATAAAARASSGRPAHSAASPA